MILFILLGIGFIIFGVFYLDDSGLLRLKKAKWFDAVLIDEVEDEIYDNTGNTKVRFFRAYEFEEDGEKKVVRTVRPLRRITNKLGKKCRILIDTKARKAVEKSDVIRYGAIAAVLALVGICIILAVVYIKLNVKGAIL